MIVVLTALSPAGGQGVAGHAPPPKRHTAPNSNQPVTPGAAATNTPATGEQPKPTDKTNDTVVRLERARIDAIDANQQAISLTDCIPGTPDAEKIVCNGKAYHLKVSDQALRAKVKLYHVGDQVRVTIKGDTELQDIPAAWSYPPEGISAYCRVLVLGACALFILALAAAVTGGAPLRFIVGADNRYSNSKTQLAVWFWVVLSSYLAAVLFRLWYAGWDFFGGVNIPQNLLVLSGLSAITYGGAKAITTSKVNAAMAPKTGESCGTQAVSGNPGAPNQASQNPGVRGANANANQANLNAPNPNLPAGNAGNPVGGNPPNPNAPATAPANPKNPLPKGGESFFRDLTQNDYGDLDFGDFQMLVVTMVAVGMYMLLIFHFLESIEFVKTATLPDVDTTILAGFGLGQGAYLAKKAGGNPGTS